MKKLNWAGLAFLAIFLAVAILLSASLLPFFIGEVWAPLWSPEYRPSGVARSFGRIGPWASASDWPVLLAIPISSALLLGGFILLVALVALRKPQGRRKRR